MHVTTSIKALAAARTWGEARQVRMTHLWNPAGPEYHESEDGYADDKPSDITEVGAVEDGDWPKMVTERAFKLLLRDRYRKARAHDSQRRLPGGPPGLRG